MSELISNIDFREGKIKYNSFALNFNLPFKDQIWEINEDLLQIEYEIRNDKYLIDLGWYPGNKVSNQSGLKVALIKNQDWDKPLLIIKCKDEAGLNKALLEAVNTVQSKKLI